MPIKNHKYDPKKVIQSIRLFAVLILGTVLLADSFAWLTQDVSSLVIMLLSVYIIVWSYMEYLSKNRKIMIWLLVALGALMLLGIIFFYLQTI